MSATTELGKRIEQVLDPLEMWACNCHTASIHLVRSGAIEGPCRVARGGCQGVAGQHSWVVLGHDCYDDNAEIIDPTLWSYDKTVKGVWYGSYRDGRHTPHGKGLIWNFGRPETAEEAGEEPMELTPAKPWSYEAERFLDLLGPLSYDGWIKLAHYPVEGWPAGEIIDAMCNTADLKIPGATMEGYVPVDRVGMLTDRNPSGLYLPENA